MKKIYKLTATRIDNNDRFISEECYFTSKNKAIKSMDYLKQYLIYKHTLNENNIGHYYYTNHIHLVNNYKTIQTFIIDNTFNVSLIEHDIKTLTLKYI